MTQNQVYKSHNNICQFPPYPRLQKCTCQHFQVSNPYHLLAKMLNILKTNPAELCSALLLIAGFVNASPVISNVSPPWDVPASTNDKLSALVFNQSPRAAPAGKRNLTLSDTIIYDLDNPTISYPTVTSSHKISLNSNIYIVDGVNTPNKTM